MDPAPILTAVSHFRILHNPNEEFIGELIAGKFYLDNIKAGVLGDYNGNNIVDAADYVVWRDNPTTLKNEGASPNMVDAADYTFWRSRFGDTSNAGLGSATGGGPASRSRAGAGVVAGGDGAIHVRVGSRTPAGVTATCAFSKAVLRAGLCAICGVGWQSCVPAGYNGERYSAISSNLAGVRR